MLVIDTYVDLTNDCNNALKNFIKRVRRVSNCYMGHENEPIYQCFIVITVRDQCQLEVSLKLLYWSFILKWRKTMASKNHARKLITALKTRHSLYSTT